MVNYFFNTTCAVVGSSSKLLEHKNGNLIDSYSIVIRSNYAPTYMYDEYVGKKTSVVVVPYHMYQKKNVNNTTFTVVIHILDTLHV